MSTTYYEVHTADGGKDWLDVTTVANAKAAAKAVATFTGSPVQLYKVTEIDVDAPTRTRSTD